MNTEATNGASNEAGVHEAPNQNQLGKTQSQSSPQDQADTEGMSPEQAKADGYPAHFVEKLKREQSNWRARAKELESKLREREEHELKEQNKYKELFEARSKELETARTQLTEYQERMRQARKMSAVKSELQKLGIRPGKEEVAFRLMDLKEVAIDDDTDTVIGADQVAKSFYDQYNDLGIWGSKVPRVAHQAPASNQQATDLSSLPLEQKLKMLAELELKNPKRNRST